MGTIKSPSTLYCFNEYIWFAFLFKGHIDSILNVVRRDNQNGQV